MSIGSEVRTPCPISLPRAPMTMRLSGSMRTNTPSDTGPATAAAFAAVRASPGRLQLASNAPLPSVVTCRNSRRVCRMALLEHLPSRRGYRSGASALRSADRRSGLERLQQLRLALRRQPRAQLLLLLGPGLLPRQSVANGVLESVELETLGDRTRGTDLRDSRLVALGRRPDRNLLTGPAIGIDGLLCQQEIATGPGDFRIGAADALARLEQLADGAETRRHGQVVFARDATLGAHAHEGGKVTHIDELDGIVRRTGRDHFATLRYAIRPIGEAVGVIPGTADVGGANDIGPLAIGLLHHRLAQHLQRTVIAIGELVGGHVADGRERVILVDGRVVEITVRRDARDEDVALRML